MSSFIRFNSTCKIEQRGFINLSSLDAFVPWKIRSSIMYISLGQVCYEVLLIVYVSVALIEVSLFCLARVTNTDLGLVFT